MKRIFLVCSIFVLGALVAFYLTPSPRKYFSSVKSADAPTSLRLSAPFIANSRWTDFNAKDGQFIAGKNDTWFVYGWFGKIASIQMVGGVDYKKYGGQHGAIDFAAKEGIPVIAAADGVVTFAGDFYGKTIRISHQDGFETLYGHLSKINVVNQQKVKKGDVIGTVGNTGTTNPHLHFEVNRRVDKDLWAINPRKLLDINWNKVVVPDFPANHFYDGDPNNPDAQTNFIWPK